LRIIEEHLQRPEQGSVSDREVRAHSVFSLAELQLRELLLDDPQQLHETYGREAEASATSRKQSSSGAAASIAKAFG